MLKDVEQFRTCGITSEILDVLKNLNSIYFNAKGIRFELFKMCGIILRGRPPAQNNVYNDHHLKLVVSSKIGHIMRKLKELGYITKISTSTWKIIKKIDVDKNDILTKKERKA